MTDSPVGLHEFNRVVRTTLLVPVTVLALLAGLLVWQVEQALDLRQHSIVNTRVSDQLMTLEQRVTDQETSLRAYQLTGLPSQLVPYNSATPEIESTLAHMRHLPAVSGISDAHVNKLEQDIRAWQTWAAGVLEQPAPAPESVTTALTQQGKGIMDGVHQDFQDALGAAARERDLYNEKLNQRVNRFLQFVLILALAAGITIGIFASSRLQRVSSTYELALEEMQEWNAKLTASQQLLATTLESIGDAVISLTTEGNVRFMNAVAQKLTGWPLSAATNHPVGEVLRLVHPQTHQPIGDVLDELARSGVMGVRLEGTLIARDGSDYAVDAKVSTVMDAEGHADGSVVVFRDVTELRKAEVTLIANEKLAVTGRLAASIAHEIHNPLDSVANLHFLISQEADPQRRSDYLKLAQQELGRTLQISRAMLSLYRESPMPVQVNLEELVEQRSVAAGSQDARPEHPGGAELYASGARLWLSRRASPGLHQPDCQRRRGGGAERACTHPGAAGKSSGRAGGHDCGDCRQRPRHCAARREEAVPAFHDHQGRAWHGTRTLGKPGHRTEAWRHGAHLEQHRRRSARRCGAGLSAGKIGTGQGRRRGP